MTYHFRLTNVFHLTQGTLLFINLSPKTKESYNENCKKNDIEFIDIKKSESFIF